MYEQRCDVKYKHGEQTRWDGFWETRGKEGGVGGREEKRGRGREIVEMEGRKEEGREGRGGEECYHVASLLYTERASKHMEELLSMAGNMKMPVENRPGDNAILRVIEAYCVGGGRGGAIRKCAVSIL